MPDSKPKPRARPRPKPKPKPWGWAQPSVPKSQNLKTKWPAHPPRDPLRGPLSVLRGPLSLTKGPLNKGSLNPIRDPLNLTRGPLSLIRVPPGLPSLLKKPIGAPEGQQGPILNLGNSFPKISTLISNKISKGPNLG